MPAAAIKCKIYTLDYHRWASGTFIRFCSYKCTKFHINIVQLLSVTLLNLSFKKGFKNLNYLYFEILGRFGKSASTFFYQTNKNKVLAREIFYNRDND